MTYAVDAGYLPGLEEDFPEPFFKLAEIFEQGVFELYRREETGCCYIPYMMNDQLEAYLILRGCRMTGEYQDGAPEYKSGRVFRNGEGYGLIVRQEGGNTFTLWFQEIEEVIRLYQYHQIGHFWVKGQEQWRQLVYILGTTYEKLEFLGEEYCNKEEKELLELMEFWPFRSFSPVKDSLEDDYPDTQAGTARMEALAMESGDKGYLRLVRLYRRFPWGFLERLLIRGLCSRRRGNLYQHIYDKMKKGSMEYGARDYGDKLNRHIQELREQVHTRLLEKGFQGVYPEYRRGSMYILAAEEHPFTVFEAEDFVFRIQFMVSVCRDPQAGRNGGFFRGRGRRGWIEKNLDFIEREIEA